jgi:hypothetical protein
MIDTAKSILSPPVFALRDTLLKRTTSRCPVCRAPCPAEVWRTGGIPQKVLLKRVCPEHGETAVCIASDARFYWLAQGNAKNACCGGQALRASDNAPAGALGRNANPGGALGLHEKLSTCLALIEIVRNCNLACPACYADSRADAARAVDAVPLADLQRRIQSVVDRKGGIEILQLSGGEPTLHPQFFPLLCWLQDHPNIRYVLLNTNGIRIANDPAFARELGSAFRRGAFQLYLQFDGVREQGQRFLRGADLRALRQRCLEICRDMNLPVTLAMTVTRENLPFLWEAVECGLAFPNVRGLCFQPMFGSGRIPAGNPDRLNTADIILAAVGQSSGRLRCEDFTPLPCGDPNCAAIGYLLKVNGQPRSLGNFIDLTAARGFLSDRIRHRWEDLIQCGCESGPLAGLLKKFRLDETHTFRLFIKPFMDALTWDQDRIDRCCTHVIRPDGKLDSFCRHYSGFPDCKSK